MGQDWRLQGQERYLGGATLRWARYQASRQTWDHDHCEFCHAKFMAKLASDVLTEGFCTSIECRWICLGCLEDFKTMFGWMVRNDDSLDQGEQGGTR